LLPAESGAEVGLAIRDIAERLAVQAEAERLRAEAERERYERRLQQSQRLESLGQLVGGVAHDFNNLLNVIGGYTAFITEHLTAKVASGDQSLQPLLGDAEQVRGAAGRAARLTRQLLTFARRDVIHPEVLDLNQVAAGVEPMLRHTLGEHIDLVITPGPGLWPVKADAGQLEQVLVNLAVNSRDAMPGGGHLSIYSEPGAGITVSALLPATPAGATSAAAAPAAPPAGDLGETILLVEDEKSLWELASRILSRGGYHVCTATTPADALRQANDLGQPIDLLLTDVIMPGMLGSELATRIRAVRLGLPVLYMSGYAQTVLDTQGALDADINLLENPFSENDLLTRVRHAIAHPPTAGQPAPAGP
jgi:two-component system, cell cycle sensor histidine kinase and response regulator CckA